MLWFRMLGVALRLAWPYWLTLWRSPLLRWRMETYGIRDARGEFLSESSITPSTFFRFLVVNRTALLRFLHWAATLDQPPSRLPKIR
jgi:hypothetical protein